MRINKLLLDTHVFLWWRSNDPLLQEAAKSAIAGADVVFVSAATAWEAGIKASLHNQYRRWLSRALPQNPSFSLEPSL